MTDRWELAIQADAGVVRNADVVVTVASELGLKWLESVKAATAKPEEKE